MVLAERIELASEAVAEPRWQKLFPMGVTKYRADFPKGIKFDAPTLQAMADNFKAEGLERAVNYFHKGASSVDAPIDAKVAAGWIKDVQVRDDGLWALMSWTEKARGHIVKDELRYLSPEFRLSGMNKNTGKQQGPTLLGAAILNDPFLGELPRVAASEESMTELAEAKKCPECGQAIEAKEKAEKSFAEAQETIKAADAQLAEQSVKLAELTEQIATLKAEKTDSEIKTFFDGLVMAGKCAPAMREGFEKLARANGLDAVKFLEAAPTVIAKGEVGVTGSTGAENSKADATKRFYAKREEYQAKGMKFSEAQKLAAAELPEDFALAFNLHS